MLNLNVKSFAVCINLLVSNIIFPFKNFNMYLNGNESHFLLMHGIDCTIIKSEFQKDNKISMPNANKI